MNAGRILATEKNN
jgi:integrase